ncbi:hypothetical protein TNCV_3283941 [Trichonephila clavipes]|nr:hypothetical protein TNCV_3283941 [Trichonephila clavipes]
MAESSHVEGAGILGDSKLCNVFVIPCTIHPLLPHPPPLRSPFQLKKFAWEHSLRANDFSAVPHKSRRSALQGSARSAQTIEVFLQQINFTVERGKEGKEKKRRELSQRLVLDERQKRLEEIHLRPLCCATCHWVST